MDDFELYFVGFSKHGSVQHLVAGPFIDQEAADSAKDAMEPTRSGGWTVCKTTLPFEVVDCEEGE